MVSFSVLLSSGGVVVEVVDEVIVEVVVGVVVEGLGVTEISPVCQLSCLSIHSMVITIEASIYSSLRLISFIDFIYMKRV